MTADSTKRVAGGGAGGLWFLGFIGALVYYIHTHSGTFWLVLLAFMKAKSTSQNVPECVWM